jgi:N-acyl-D-amino-acid deacylase
MLDLVIHDALVVDGTGREPFVGSVGVTGDRIEWIGPGPDPDPPGAARSIDASGLALAPGFVDAHSHADLSALVLPDMPSVIRQGVTTVVVGNCGSSPWPWAGWDEAVRLAAGDPSGFPRPRSGTCGDYLAAIGSGRPAVNVATLVGHGSVRLEVMGRERRPPSAAELSHMRALVAEAMEAGVFGLSSGLIYVPGMFADTSELVALASEAGRAGGLYTSHIRGEGRDLFAAVDEAIEIGRRSGSPVHVSHLKCESTRAWGRVDELLARLHDAEDATGDQYPYAAWNSSLASLLPPWAPVEDAAAIASADRERLRAAVEEGEPGFQSSIDGVGWERIVVVETADHRWRASDLATIAREMGLPPFDAFLRLLGEDPETSCIGHAMDDHDVAAILSAPSVFVASDGSAVSPTGSGGDLPVHPREYGTFPRALARCRDEALLPLAAVVRKMTALPAGRFGLADRGRIAEGGFADLVLFDPGTIADTATYEQPHAFPTGLSAVLVNGEVAWEAGRDAIARAGRVLRRAG